MMYLTVGHFGSDLHMISPLEVEFRKLYSYSFRLSCIFRIFGICFFAGFPLCGIGTNGEVVVQGRRVFYQGYD